MNFYPHHIGDFNNSTRHLTRVERSVYRDAIELYYDTESALTLDMDKLYRKLICSSDEEKNAINAVLDEFFLKTNDGYTHERCDIEIAKYRSNTNAKAKGGLASAAKRKRNSTPVEHTLNACATNQEPLTKNQEPLTKNQEPLKIQRKKSAGDFDALGALESLGVTETVAKDFLTIRKKKHAPLTETALDDIRREAEKAHLSINQVLEKCCARGWQGFEASWMKGGAPPADSRKQINRDNYDRQAREAREKCGKDEPRDITVESSRID